MPWPSSIRPLPRFVHRNRFPSDASMARSNSGPAAYAPLRQKMLRFPSVDSCGAGESCRDAPGSCFYGVPAQKRPHPCSSIRQWLTGFAFVESHVPAAEKMFICGC